ncbi:MAG TPA: rhodanese-like domain-containing protein [Thermoanaerobaculia bacterium]|jgi:thiosulfate/3-mercaptopyruvate sulfurtransferase
MAMKTGWRATVFFLLGAAAPLAGQRSPLQWPVPPPAPPREPVFPRVLIGARELAGLLKAGNAVPFDARGTGPYERGHLPGAVPAWSAEEESPGGGERVRSLLARRGIAGDKAVALYGDPDREAVARLFWLLRLAGCPEIRILDGGLSAWRAAGGALATGSFRGSPSELRAFTNSTAAVDSAWVANSFGQAGIELLDVRDARGWDQWRTPPTFGAGHIPHSLPFDPGSLLPAGGGWPEPAEIRRRLGILGPRPGDTVSLESTFVLYGEDARDPRSGLGYLLLTLAGLEARVFVEGWREWIEGGRRPVVRVVSAAELASLLKRENPGMDQDRPPRGMILLDLREQADFAIGHLPGALSLPYHLFAEAFEKKVEEAWPGADRATLPLVLYCYGPECVRSRNAGTRAAHLGFRHVLWFRGGTREWWEAGLPLLDSPAATAAPAPASPGRAAARP